MQVVTGSSPPRSRSEATQIAFRPCSRISRASVSRSLAFCGRASLISIGRLTPVITSTWRSDEGDAEIRRRAAEHVGQHEHAAGRSVPPAAPTPARSPRRSPPRVLDVFVPADRHGGEVRQIADDHFRRVDQLGRELPVRHDDHANFICDRGFAHGLPAISAQTCELCSPSLAHRAMSRCLTRRRTPGIPDSPSSSLRRSPPIGGARRCTRFRPSDSVFPSATYCGTRNLQQVQRVLRGIHASPRAIEEAHHLLVAPGMRTKRRHEMRVRQKPDVEQQIQVDRNAVFEAEAQNRDDQLCAGRARRPRRR